MRSRHRLNALFLCLSVVVTACGSSNATGTPVATPQATVTTPSTTEAPAASASPTDTVAPTPSSTATPTPSPTAAGAADWPMYHADPQRTGVAASFPALGKPSIAWKAGLDGAVYGQPLGVDGRIFAATENDTVYALDPARGSVVWSHHLATPVRRSTLPCGNIDPLGITSTPVFDRETDTLFVSAEIAGPKHELIALNPATGAVRWTRDLDQAGDDPHVYQQRAALALANGYVYIGFGGLAGDCGQYRGVVVGVPANGSGGTLSYRVPVQREGAVWATAGPVVDPATGDLYISVGNGASTTTFDGSDSVVQLSPQLQMKSFFAPSRWPQDNAADLDLGSLSPSIVQGKWVFISGKAGIGYVMRLGALGGIGGQVSKGTVCGSFGGTAVDGSAVYVPCLSGVARIQIDSSGAIVQEWQTTSGANAAPVVGGGAVWSVNTDAGALLALSPASGAARATIGIGAVPHFASPTLWHGLVLVGTMNGVVAVKPA